METKKVGDMAEDYGVQMNIHMAESPIACMAAVHVAAATRNFMALELHSVDVPWWGDLVKPALSYRGGFIKVPTKPGLGIDVNVEEVVKRPYKPRNLRHYTGTLTDIRPKGDTFYYFDGLDRDHPVF